MGHILSALTIITLFIIFHPKNRNMRKGIKPKRKLKSQPRVDSYKTLKILYEGESNPYVKKHYESALRSLSCKN